MALQEKLDLSTDKVFALGDGADKLKRIDGYYLGSRAVNTTNGKSVIHVFKTPSGNTGIWGTAKLNNNLSMDDLGVYQVITYKGKVKIAGGKTQHTYKFECDSDNTIDVPRLPPGAAATEVDLVEQEDDTDEVPTQTNRTQHVSNLLNKNNKQA